MFILQVSCRQKKKGGREQGEALVLKEISNN